jgi:hypothetical protein
VKPAPNPRPRRGRSVRTVVVAGAGLLTLGLAACGSQSTAAEVGDRSISREDLLGQLGEWGALNGFGSETTTDAGAAAQWTSWWVQFSALEQWAAAEGITVSAEAEDAARDLLVSAFPEARIEGNAALEQLVGWQALLETLAADPGLQADALAANPQLQAPQLCTRHILLETEADAEEVLELLDDGEEFSALAIERSTDPSAVATGGDLGCAPEGSFVPEFEEAAWAAEVGDVVGPVETDFGFHVIEVLDRVEPTPEQLGPQLQEALIGELFTGTWSGYAGVFDGRRIEIDPRFGTWDPTFRLVLPPEGPTPPPELQLDLGEGIPGS